MGLLLDGFNEVGDNNIRQLQNGLDKCAANHEQHYTLITSRAYNFRFGGERLPVLDLLELTYPDGVEEYIRCYLGNRLATGRLMQILKSKLRMRRLAVNPLLLRLIILVYENEGHVPNSHGMLFSKSIRGLLGKWELPAEANRLRMHWFEDKHVLLSQLGYVMKEEGLELSAERAKESFEDTLRKRSDWFSPDNQERPLAFDPPSGQGEWADFIDELKEDHILFQTSDAKIIRIWHQTIQEYSAACCIWDEIRPLLDQGDKQGRLSHGTRKRLEARLTTYVDDSSCHKILAIMIGLISAGEGDAIKTGMDHAD